MCVSCLTGSFSLPSKMIGDTNPVGIMILIHNGTVSLMSNKYYVHILCEIILLQQVTCATQTRSFRREAGGTLSLTMDSKMELCLFIKHRTDSGDSSPEDPKHLTFTP
ncbi:hypothetical protein CapIbe_005370 [Capra ibex]